LKGKRSSYRAKSEESLSISEDSIKIREIPPILNTNNENKMVISLGNCLIFVEFPSNYNEDFSKPNPNPDPNPNPNLDPNTNPNPGSYNEDDTTDIGVREVPGLGVAEVPGLGVTDVPVPIFDNFSCYSNDVQIDIEIDYNEGGERSRKNSTGSSGNLTTLTAVYMIYIYMYIHVCM
jgi:hypothetical protein